MCDFIMDRPLHQQEVQFQPLQSEEPPQETVYRFREDDSVVNERASADEERTTYRRYTSLPMMKPFSPYGRPVHRGEMEIEYVKPEQGQETVPYVRVYLTVFKPAQREGSSYSSEYKDIHQDEHGRIQITHPKGSTLYLNFGMPARALGWTEKYKAQQPVDLENRIKAQLEKEDRAAAEKWKRTGDVTADDIPYIPITVEPQPVIRSFLVPLENVNKILRDAKNQRDHRRGVVENSDQQSAPNQYGVPAELVTELNRYARPGSLISYTDRERERELADEEGAFAGTVKTFEDMRQMLSLPAHDVTLRGETIWTTGVKFRDSKSQAEYAQTLGIYYDVWQMWKKNYRPDIRLPEELVGNKEAAAKIRKNRRQQQNLFCNFLWENRAAILSPGQGNKELILFRTLQNLFRKNSGDPDPDMVHAIDVFMSTSVESTASLGAMNADLAQNYRELGADWRVGREQTLVDYSSMIGQRQDEISDPVDPPALSADRIEEITHRIDGRVRQIVGSDTDLTLQVNELIEEWLGQIPELKAGMHGISNDSENYSFRDHAQLVLQRYFTLARSLRGGEPLIPHPAMVKMILFHDIYKAASKTLFGGGEDKDAEHVLPAREMERYRGLWYDPDQWYQRYLRAKETKSQEDLDALKACAQGSRDFIAVKLMMDSDPFGKYFKAYSGRSKAVRNASDKVTGIKSDLDHLRAGDESQELTLRETEQLPGEKQFHKILSVIDRVRIENREWLLTGDESDKRLYAEIVKLRFALKDVEEKVKVLRKPVNYQGMRTQAAGIRTRVAAVHAMVNQTLINIEAVRILDRKGDTPTLISPAAVIRNFIENLDHQMESFESKESRISSLEALLADAEKDKKRAEEVLDGVEEIKQASIDTISDIAIRSGIKEDRMMRFFQQFHMFYQSDFSSYMSGMIYMHDGEEMESRKSVAEECLQRSGHGMSGLAMGGEARFRYTQLYESAYRELEEAAKKKFLKPEGESGT